jgi:hypothetical protein
MAASRVLMSTLAFLALGAVVPSKPPAQGNTTLERSGLRVLAAERRSPELVKALGHTRLSVVQVGDLEAHGRRLGATMLLALAAPRRHVRATVPAYIPADDPNAPYTRQRVRMHVAVLRDLLVDIDLRSRRIIALEPGPRSQTLSWSPSQAPAPAGATDED